MVVLFFAAAIVAQAEQAINAEIKISKIDPVFVDTPKVAGGTYIKKVAGGARPTPWVEVEVAFERVQISKSMPKFAGELTFNYYIVFKNQLVSPDNKQTLVTGSVTHVNIPDGKDLHSSIYVSPRSLSKIFEGKVPTTVAQAIVDVGVTVTGKDGLLAVAAWKTPVTKDGKGWWDNPIYSSSPGLLLNKSETPFASLEWDFFENIKSKAAN